MTRRALLAAAAAFAQKPVEFICPMDSDIRSPHAGRCRRCGMKLVAGLPDPIAYRVKVERHPDELVFRVYHPKTGKQVTKFELIHEKLFHLFAVDSNLSTFTHEHPEVQSDGAFRLKWRPPIAAEYRFLMDFYPTGATPQLITRTLILNNHGREQVEAKPNLSITLRTEPEQPLAGQKTMLFFALDPATDLQPYLGAMGHLLAVSGDTIDMLHTHPAWEETGPTIQFNVIFPRPGRHKLWVQFQRAGIVNTKAFEITAVEL